MPITLSTGAGKRHAITPESTEAHRLVPSQDWWESEVALSPA
jgi:hypothetical protein